MFQSSGPLKAAMMCLTCSQLSSSSLKPPFPRFSSSLLPDLKPFRLRSGNLNNVRRVRSGTCRAELSQDAPFAAAIGACMLSSLVLPGSASSDEDGDAAMDTTDARFAVMGIISFIPYFNWLGWVFAWLDTGKRRYAVYALAYLAPYIRSNLSLSPEESWLPIASIVFCIIHVQLEASIKNGDIQGFKLFTDAARRRGPHSEDNQGLSEEERGHMNLPSAGKKRTLNDIRQWDVPRKPLRDQESKREGLDDDDHRKER